MAVRTVSNRGGNTIGHFPSLKLGRMVAFESTIERDYLYLLDYDPLVRSFAEQPLTLPYVDGGKIRQYTPDFMVQTTTGPRVIECKPHTRLATADNQRIFAAAAAWCHERSWAFVVVTDQQLRAGHRLKNIRRLTQFARHTVDPQLHVQLFAYLTCTKAPWTITQLAYATNPMAPAAVIPNLLHLAFHHHVTVALDDAPLCGDTLIALPHQASIWRDQP